MALVEGSRAFTRFFSFLKLKERKKKNALSPKMDFTDRMLIWRTFRGTTGHQWQM